MATRWWFSERAGAAGTALLLLLAPACVTQTSVSYLPSPDQPRLDLAEGQTMLNRFVGLECERLREQGRAEGAAQLRVRLDSAGTATQAELAASSGDSRVDGVMGAIAAQLQVAPAPSPGTVLPVRASYRCDADGSVSARLERA